MSAEKKIFVSASPPVVICVLAILSLAAIFFLKSAIHYLSFRYDVVCCSRIVYNLYLFVNGKPLYEHYCNLRGHLTLYTPLYYVLLACLAKLTNAVSYASLLFLSRSVTLFCSLLSAALIFLISLRLKYKKTIASIASLLFLGNPLLFGLGFSGHVDLMALTCSLFAIYMILIQEKGSFLYLSVIFSLLAFYTKQSYVSVAMAIVLYFCFKGEFQQLRKFASVYLVVGSAVFLWLNYITKGLFYLNGIMALILVVPHYLCSLFLVLNQMWWKLIPIFILIVIASVRLKGLNLLIKIYALFSFIVAFFSSTGIWSGDNYWLETLASGVFLAAPMIDQFRLKKDKILIVVFLPLFLFAYLRFPVAYLRGRLKTKMESSLYSKNLLVDFLKQTKGEVFYDGEPDVVINSGKDVFAADWSTRILLIKKNKCTDLEIIDRIKKKRFTCLVLSKGYNDSLLTTRMKEAIKNNYRIMTRIGSCIVLTPLE